ncbi:carbohydrate ABC transporter permease [Streptomyces sp. NPDC056835]|uniref:carbohydrate ABC transporter permease n=1 Tax=Streptomyces sp. NPDC056835 TaxID=3345956 RepID=UPI0036AFBAFE
MSAPVAPREVSGPRKTNAPHASRRPDPSRNQGPRRLFFREKSRLLGAWLITLAFILPVYVAFVSAFKTQDQILANPAAPPVPFTFDNIVNALRRPDNLVQAGLLNSVFVTVATLVILVPLSSMLAFYISERTPRVRNTMLAVFALGLMVPPQVVLLPIVTLLREIGLANSYAGLILSNVGGGYLSFAVFVYVGFLRTIPREVIEAARVDGAGDLRLWWRIVFPVVRPATATVAIFLGLWVWNDFLNPQFILGPLQGQTITTGIYVSLGAYSTDYSQLFGIMFLAAIIPVVGYLVSQREFIHGLMSGASK